MTNRHTIWYSVELYRTIVYLLITSLVLVTPASITLAVDSRIETFEINDGPYKGWVDFDPDGDRIEIFLNSVTVLDTTLSRPHVVLEELNSAEGVMVRYGDGSGLILDGLLRSSMGQTVFEAEILDDRIVIHSGNIGNGCSVGIEINGRQIDGFSDWWCSLLQDRANPIASDQVRPLIVTDAPWVTEASSALRSPLSVQRAFTGLSFAIAAAIRVGQGDESVRTMGWWNCAICIGQILAYIAAIGAFLSAGAPAGGWALAAFLIRHYLSVAGGMYNCSVCARDLKRRGYE